MEINRVGTAATRFLDERFSDATFRTRIRWSTKDANGLRVMAKPRLNSSKIFCPGTATIRKPHQKMAGKCNIEFTEVAMQLVVVCQTVVVVIINSVITHPSEYG